MTTWQVAEAKNKFSELITKALNEGPQRVRRRDQAIIIISESEYQRLTGNCMTLKDFILQGPDISDLDLTRDTSPMRDADL